MKVAFASLAKLGDIVNVLPMCADQSRKGNQVSFLHDARLSPLFQGVSYVKSLPQFALHTRALSLVDQARASGLYDLVFNCQPFGPTYKGPYDLPHNVRSWTACGYSSADFYDVTNFPLVFDRDAERESFVCRNLSGLPLICLALTAQSSIFAHRERLEAEIRRRWANCDIVDLARVKAGRFYDLLGLLDRAAILVTVDTSIMHLAAASKVPTVCLIGDDARTAAEPRFKPLLRLSYSSAMAQVHQIHAAIKQKI